MTRKTLPENAGDPTTLIQQVGRAATPPVKKSPFNIKLADLLRTSQAASSDLENILVLSRTDITEALSTCANCIVISPGTGTDIASEEWVDRIVVDSEAFISGPWINADQHESANLAHELYEISRLARTAGKPVYFIHRKSFSGPLTAKISSASDLIFPVDSRVENIVTVEGAAQTPFWNHLLASVNERFA